MLPVFAARKWPWEPNHSSRRGLLPVASGLFVFLTAIASVSFLLAPVLRRLHLQFGLTLFDYGFYGLYPTRHYVSFDLASPDVELARWDSRCSDDYVFMAPHGKPIEGSWPLILDARGNLVWTMPTVDTTQDFHVQEYLGEKYLTYWHGENLNGHGLGSWSMLDSSYVHRFEVVTIGDFDGDLHDFQITSNGTALAVIYDLQAANLMGQGGPQSGFIYDGVFQEIDIATGNLLFEWRTSQHVPLDSSYKTLGVGGKDRSLPWDPYHINSIDKDEAGNYLVSMRHTHALYSIDGTTGEILWTLGGKANQFIDVSDGQATNFAWQHDARWRDNRTITLFNNNAKDFLGPVTQSRGMILDIDVSNRVVGLRASYFHPEGLRAASQGNVQILPDSGNVFIGWGHCAAYTEFAPDGEVLCDTHYGPSNWFQLSILFSYRVYKSSWVGRPLTIPAAAVIGDSVYVSWNGATEIVAWRLELWDGSDLNDMNFLPSTIVEKNGFETKIELPKALPNIYFRVVALDDQHDVLGRTEVLAKHRKNTFAEALWNIWNMMSRAVLITVLMLVCCVILAIFWIWTLWPSRFRCHLGRRFRFQPVSTDEHTAIPLMNNNHDHAD